MVGVVIRSASIFTCKQR